jgi:hypothetical protein
LFACGLLVAGLAVLLVPVAAAAFCWDVVMLERRRRKTT